MSGRKRSVSYSRDSRIDLSDILHYSERRWDRVQRSAYQKRIEDAVKSLSNAPEIGRPRDELFPGLRSHPVGSHVIYYWIIGDRLRIAHILHNRMDAGEVDWSVELNNGDE